MYFLSAIGALDATSIDIHSTPYHHRQTALREILRRIEYTLAIDETSCDHQSSSHDALTLVDDVNPQR